VRSIVALCHGLGLQVVAEGVERPAQLEFLSHCGPLGVQGYLLAYPVEAHQAEDEAKAAASRAKLILENAAKSPESAGVGSSLVFVGPTGGRKRSN
jgi:predicted signal transduction protein with EAL and GGDEF domain